MLRSAAIDHQASRIFLIKTTTVLLEKTSSFGTESVLVQYIVLFSI